MISAKPDTADFPIAPGELGHLRIFLYVQNIYPAYRQLTAADATKYIEHVSMISHSCLSTRSVKLKAWLDLFFTAFLSLEECAMMFWAIRYRNYVQWKKFDPNWWLKQDPWISYWHAYHNGWKVYTENESYPDELRPVFILTRGDSGFPPGPEIWVAKLAEAYSSLAADLLNPDPRYILSTGVAFNNTEPIHTFQNKILSEWKDFPSLTERIMPLWNNQWELMKAFVADGELDNKSYFFLLHLLIALGVGNRQMTDYVASLTQSKASTEVYPEETFINQLTYLILMFLSDVREPETKYAWNNTQLQQFVKELRAIINTEKPGSNAIAKSLDFQLALLNSVASYPLIDPECGLPLSQRKAITRAGLNKALRLSMPDA